MSWAEQFQLLAELLVGADGAAPTRLTGWTVADLAGHVISALELMGAALSAPPPSGPPVNIVDYYAGAGAFASVVDERARDRAAGRSLDQLREDLAVALRGAVDAVAAADPKRLISLRRALPLEEFLVTRCVEGTVHTLDLADAVGAEPPLDPDAVAASVRLLTQMLAAHAPGRAVEVRIPPYAAVQCLPGPRHTRGTPPNTVETDPITWLELTTGRLPWADALVTGRVRASGVRADVSGQLPLLR
jgi:uncharacterized protein (TIGR03083 family)